MKGYYVEVRVGPVLKQYTEHSLNMDIIRPGQGSILVDLMRPYLERRNYEQLDLFGGDDSSAPTDKQTIKIEMPFHNGPVYNHSAKKVVKYNSLYRTELSKYGQAIVRRHLKKIMRHAFHTYMDGYTSKCEDYNQKRVKAGVTSFFSDYSIEFTEKDVSAFCRDWFRYRDKKYNSRVSPLIY